MRIIEFAPSMCFRFARLRRALLEARVDFLSQKYVPLLKDALAANRIRIPASFNSIIAEQPGVTNEEKVFQLIALFDPDPNKKNTQWLLTVLLAGNMQFEDLERAQDYLALFQRVKGKLPTLQRDLNRVKSLPDLYEIIKPFTQESVIAADTEEVEKMSRPPHAMLLYSDAEDWKVLQIFTKEAACFWGRPTEWCTAWGDAKGRHPARTSYYSQYPGPLFVIANRETRWQYHLGTGQFADITDRMINGATFAKQVPSGVTDALNTAILKNHIADIGGENGVKYPVYQMADGLIAKQEATFYAKKVLDIKIQDGKFTTAEESVHFIAEDVADLLNRLHIGGDPNGDTSEAKFYLYFRDDKWQTLRQAAKPFMRFPNGWYWGKVETDRGADMILVTDLERVFNAYLHDGTFSLLASDKRQWPVLSPHVADLLLKLNAYKWTHTYGGEFGPADLNKEDAARLIKKKPYLGDLETVYKVYGVTKATKKLTTDKLEELDVSNTGIWIGDRLVVQEWKPPNTVEGCIDDIGTEDGKHFFKNIDDLEVYDVDADNYQKRDFFDYLASKHPDVLHKLGVWLAEQHEEIVEEIDDYDPSNKDDVVRLFDETEDDDLSTAMDNAVRSGLESGGQDEAFTIVKHSFENNPYLLFQNGKKWTGEFVWDVPIVFAVPMKDVIHEIQNDECYNISHDGWAEALDAQLNPESPYNGLSDYSEDAANEVFLDQLESLLP